MVRSLSPRVALGLLLGALGCGGTSERPLTGVVSVAAGIFHTCAVLDDGTAKCWGEDDSSELGDGDVISDVVATPAAVTNLIGVKALVAGRYYTCALKADATVVCWGDNTECELGAGCVNGSPGSVLGASNVRTRTAVSGISGPVVAVRTGATFDGSNEYTCALLSDGTIQCWGPGVVAIEPDPAIPLMATTVTGITDVAELALSGGFACARLTEGTVECWGAYLPGQASGGPFTATPTAVNGLSGVVAIAAGEGHACALLAGGTVACWGGNSSGELGDGSMTDSLTPVMVNNLSGAVSIAAASEYTCAILSDGTVRCWGRYPEPGSTNLTPASVPGLTGVTAISASPTTTCVVVSGGSVKCWGDDSSGQLGIGVPPQPSAPYSATPVTVVKGS